MQAEREAAEQVRLEEEAAGKAAEEAAATRAAAVRIPARGLPGPPRNQRDDTAAPTRAGFNSVASTSIQ